MAVNGFHVGSFGGGVPSNPNYQYEIIGALGDGQGTNVISPSTAHTKAAAPGSAVPNPSGVTVNAWNGFELVIRTTNARWMFDIYFGSVLMIPDVVVWNGAANGVVRLFFPMKVPAGTQLRIRPQASGATSQQRFYFIGRYAEVGANVPPGFENCESITTADPATTMGSLIDVPFSNTTPVYTQLAASLARTYGALTVQMMHNNVNPTNNDQLRAILAQGAGNSPIGSIGVQASTSGGIILGQALIEQSIPAGQSLSAAVLAGTPSTNNGRFTVQGYW
jgi:hypothetical protein